MSFIKFSHKEKEQEAFDSLLEEDKSYSLVLFNDDVNTFEWVIECLMRICDHEEIQAEQSAYIVHYKGKCAVKTGTWDELESMHRSLSDCDLSAEIA